MLSRQENEAEKTPGEDGIGIGLRNEVGGGIPGEGGKSTGKGSEVGNQSLSFSVPVTGVATIHITGDVILDVSLGRG